MPSVQKSSTRSETVAQKVVRQLQGVVDVITALITVVYLILRGIFIAILPHALQRKKSVAGLRVVITGAGGALGRQLAIRFAQRGSTLVLLDINDAANAETKKECEALGAKTTCHNCDITKCSEVEKCVSKIEAQEGPIDIAINNAGYMGKASLVWESDETAVRRTFEVNILSHFWMCKAVLPRMIARKSGHLVSIVSGIAICGLPGLAEYSASKAAALGFMESLWMEVYSLGLEKVIKLTTVLPDFMDTPLFDRDVLDIFSVDCSTYVIKVTGHISGGVKSALKRTKTKFD